MLEYSELHISCYLMLTARFGRPGICQESRLKSFQQRCTADTGRCSYSLAAASKDVGQASGGEWHASMWCFRSLTKQSLLWQMGREQSISSLSNPFTDCAITMSGKWWDEAHILAAEGSSPEQAGYLTLFFVMFLSYSSFDQMTLH